MSHATLSTKSASTSLQDPHEAVNRIAEEIRQPEMGGVVLFCSPNYDLAALGSALKAAFDCPVVGCTTAGEIGAGEGYLEGGIVATSFCSAAVSMHPVLLEGLSQLDSPIVDRKMAALEKLAGGFDPRRQFALLLVDGLSLSEERVCSTLYDHLRGVSLVGGSAGDEMKFQQTAVYHDGGFHSDAAVLTLFDCRVPFRTFRLQHFEPGTARMVITAAHPETRVVHEINGALAAEEYAAAVGVPEASLGPGVFAANPVLLKVGGEYYVRSPQAVRPDGALVFYCAIDTGLVVTLGKGRDIVGHLERELLNLQEEVGGLEFVLGCDCILRRLEMQQTGQLETVSGVMQKTRFLGFSTYGEQYNGLHINQTLTGVALGRGESA